MPTTVLGFPQTGTYNSSTGVWADGGIAVMGDPAVEFWIRMVRANMANDVAIGGNRVTALTVQVSTLAALGDGDFTVLGMNKLNASTITTALPPRPLSAITRTVSASLDGTPQALTIPLHSTDGRATGWFAGLMSNYTNAYIGFIWGGTSGIMAISSPTVTYEGNFTGLVGHEQARGRADECLKCGGKSTRDTWVRDGFTNQMVCPHCYDEQDLVGRHYQGLGSERPGQGEG